MTTTAPADLLFSGITGQAAALARRDATGPDLVRACLERIERLDPQLRAFRTVRPDAALREADDAQALRDAGDPRPLLGVPLAVKDTTDVAGETAWWGTGAAVPSRAADVDDELVRRLRAAGMIVIGLTNLPELLLWPFTESPTHGRTRNPYQVQVTPGGSSGGSAAAVASGMVPAATASDGGGSIRIPASCCGLVGLKPTHARVPLTPADHWRGLSHAGVLTRTVADTVALLRHAVDDGDLLAAQAGSPLPPLTVGWTTKPPSLAAVSGEVRNAVRRVTDELAALGHTVVRRPLAFGELAHVFLPRFLRGCTDDLEQLRDPAAVERRTRTVARLGSRVPDAMLERADRDAERAAERVAASMGSCDVVVLPVLTTRPWRVGKYAGHGALRTMVELTGRIAFCPPFNITGMPAISVPAARTADGVPIGVQIVARRGQDGLLLALAAQLEERIGWPSWRPGMPDS